MSAGHRNTVDRLIATLLALLKSATDRHRLLPRQHQATRDAVNALLGQVSDNDFTEALQKLYRIVEADARKRACRSAALISDRAAPRRITVDPPPPKTNGNQP